jgi:hypothetical protein
LDTKDALMKFTIDPKPSNLFERVVFKLKRVFRDRKRVSLRKPYLTLAPVAIPGKDQDFSVHILLCNRDFEMSICALRSFVHYCGRSFEFVIHEDGTLTQHQKEYLRKNFPKSEIIDYDRSLNLARDTFGENSEIYKMRKRGVLMLKLLDIKLFSKKQKIIVLDSDILFFKKPVELLDAATRFDVPSLFNKDVLPSLMAPKEVLEGICSQKIPERINSGLSVVYRDAIDFELIEKWLKELNDRKVDFIMHRIEQSLITMLCVNHKNGIDYLPEAYDVSFDKNVDQSVCKHYVGIIRHGFELEGLTYLEDKGIL